VTTSRWRESFPSRTQSEAPATNCVRLWLRACLMVFLSVLSRKGDVAGTNRPAEQRLMSINLVAFILCMVAVPAAFGP